MMFGACVIDDDMQTVVDMKTSLNRLGCEVIVSEGSKESLQKISLSFKIDIAFISLSLRNGGALSVARLVKENCPESKIFLITGWKGALDNSILTREGFSGIIQRPPRFSEIKRALIGHLG